MKSEQFDTDALEFDVILEKGNLFKEQDFTILADPRSEVSSQQMKTQFDFINKVNKTVDKAHKAISSIRSICEKLTDFEKNYSSNLKVETLIKHLSPDQLPLHL